MKKKLFLFHIFTNLIKNLLKYENNKNVLFKNAEINKKYLEITNNDEYFKNIKFNSKEKFKNCLILYDDLNKLGVSFLKKFNNYLKQTSAITKVTFKRHLKTKFNKNQFLGSRINPPIIKKKTSFNKKIIYDLIYSSPLKRALDTAKLYKNNNMIISSFLKEIDYGNFELLTFKEVQKIDPVFSSKLSRGLDPKFPKGESTTDVLVRVKKFIQLLLTNNKKIKILVVTHNVFLRCLIGFLFNVPINKWYLIKIDYNNEYKFIIFKNRLLPNINRSNLKKLFYKLYE